MYHFSDYRFAIVILIGLINIGVALLISRKKYRAEVSRYFALFTLFLGCWDISNTFVLATTSLNQKAFWLGTTNIVGTAALTALLHFIILFPQLSGKPFVGFKKTYLWLIWLLAAAVTFLPGVTQSLAATSGHTQLNTWVYVVNLYDLSLVLAIVYFFISKFRHLTGKSKEQIKFIIFGIFLFLFGAVLFNVILPAFGFLALSWLGPITGNFMLTTVTYAILTHSLLDIRIILRRILIYFILLLFILAIYNVEIIIFLHFPIFSQNSSLSLIGNFLGALIIGFNFEPLRLRLEILTGNFFFKREQAQQELLKKLSNRLNTVIALDESLELIMQTVVRVMQLGRAVTFVFQPGENGKMVIKRIKQIGHFNPHDLFLSEKDFIIEYFSKEGGILFVDDFKQQLKVNKQTARSGLEIRQLAIQETILNKLLKLEVAVAIPLQVNQQLIGLILLSNKKSGQPFHPQDLDLLESLESQVTSSIEKAKLYEGDQMKSEFVSIASHELLTPISAIEGYLSLILDERRGKVDEQVQGYLQKVYTSAKRLSVLIKDLLSVSSIESGHLKIEPQSLDLDKMIKEAIDQLRFVAQNKNLTLTYQSPQPPLPPVIADPDRTTQVLINLLSNAIKYTKEGTITIKATLSQQNFPHIKVEVIDTGIGMSAEAQSHLFEKFYRVDSPETVGIIGTGLGLYITKSIVERMGGSITIKSTPGIGTNFSFTLPLFKVESSTRMPA